MAIHYNLTNHYVGLEVLCKSEMKTFSFAQIFSKAF